MSCENVLALLYAHEGSYLSGEWMSSKLGVSRSAVWKQISVLRKQGYEIDSVPNRGYSLKKVPLRVEEVKLGQLLGDTLLGRDLVCVPSIGSTNTEVKLRASSGAREGLVVISEEQTAGRGRRGRSFHSPAGQGLYLSVLLRPNVSFELVSDLTAWVAVAVWRGIVAYVKQMAMAEGICDKICDKICDEIGIKWTNDLVCEGKKFCGILTELVLESESEFVDSVIVGIGLNLRQKAGDFPLELCEIATSLGMILGDEVDSTVLSACLIFALEEMYQQFPHGKASYLETYRAHCITLGKEVQVLRGESMRRGRALEVDDGFRLLVEYEDGEREALSFGEVSVRGMYGYIS